MMRVILLLLLAGGVSAWAQDNAGDTDRTEPTQSTDSESTDDEVDEFEDLDLDNTEDHTTDDQEEEFKPTDVVSYQQSVPFPVDI